ncbi:MAG: amidohydrolase family protein [Terriglobia bacterium]
MRSPIPIVDCHGHIGIHPDFPAYKTEPEEMIAVMDVLNIQVLAVTSTLACYNNCPRGNAEVEEVLRRYPERFMGYVTVNPNPRGQALEELNRWAHFHSPPLVKLHPATHHYAISGANYAPIWDYANQTGAVVLVHTWDSDPLCGPLLLAPIARAHPRATILIGHSGVTWRGYEQALEAARECSNLYLDIAGSQSHRTVLEHCVEAIGAERVLFGSDMPYLEAAVSVGRVLTARIADAAKEMILRQNFLRLITAPR